MTAEHTIERVARAILDGLRENQDPHRASFVDDFDPKDFTTIDGYFDVLKAARLALSSLRPGDPLPGGMVVEQGWLPIETAPRDGSLVLAHSPLGGCGIHPSSPTPPAAETRAAHLAIYNETGEWPNAGWNPTHWRPLPLSPKQKEEGE